MAKYWDASGAFLQGENITFACFIARPCELKND